MKHNTTQLTKSEVIKLLQSKAELIVQKFDRSILWNELSFKDGKIIFSVDHSLGLFESQPHFKFNEASAIEYVWNHIATDLIHYVSGEYSAKKFITYCSELPGNPAERLQLVSYIINTLQNDTVFTSVVKKPQKINQPSKVEIKSDTVAPKNVKRIVKPEVNSKDERSNKSRVYLDERQKRQMYILYSEGSKKRDLANRFNVALITVNRIIDKLSRR